MSTNTDTSKLDDLIHTVIDSIKGFENSAEDSPDGRFASFFRDMARERREVATKLQAQSRALGGTPPIAGYFPDGGAYTPEGDTFWVRGQSRADVILRAPVSVDAQNQATSLRLRRLALEIANGPKPNRVVVSAGWRRTTIDLAPGEVRQVDFKPAGGVPYKPSVYPTNYIYTFSVSSAAGFVPFLEENGSSDSRYLGASVKVTPVY